MDSAMSAAVVGVVGSVIGALVGGAMAIKAAHVQWERAWREQRRQLMKELLTPLMEEAREVYESSDVRPEDKDRLLPMARTIRVMAAHEHHLFHALSDTNSLLTDRNVPPTAAVVKRAARRYVRISESWAINPDGFREDSVP